MEHFVTHSRSGLRREISSSQRLSMILTRTLVLRCKQSHLLQFLTDWKFFYEITSQNSTESELQMKFMSEDNLIAEARVVMDICLFHLEWYKIRKFSKSQLPWITEITIRVTVPATAHILIQFAYNFITSIYTGFFTGSVI